jgi:2-(1,2-epoxy-1,2-dihydrophenyl)acetyl-CoA isomerase
MSDLKRKSVGDESLRLTLNRPEKLNALNTDLLSALTERIQDANGEYRIVIVDGSGEAFCSGADLDEDAGPERLMMFQDLTRTVRAFKGIVIGELHGYAVGGGFELTLSFDLRYAAKDTTFRMTESEIGVTVSNATTKLLPLVVGDGVARELVFTGREISATEAADLGLVSGVYDAESLHREVLAVAHDLVENKSHKALLLNKLAFDHAFPVETDLDYEELLGRRHNALASEID